MDVKQKTALYSDAVVLMIAGGGFLLKGLSSSCLLYTSIAVSSSLQLLQGKTIDVKFIYILGVSFVSAALMEWLCVKAGILRYEKREEIG